MAHRRFSLEATTVIDNTKYISKLRAAVSDNHHNLPQNPVLVTREGELTFLIQHGIYSWKERFHFFNFLVQNLCNRGGCKNEICIEKCEHIFQDK